jgi:hypothetical protein
MDEDILSELDRQLTSVNLDKYWVRKIGDFELWLTSIDYTQSNKVKKVLDGEFGLEEAKRVTLSSAIVWVNGVDLRPLRAAGKTIKVKDKAGKAELVDLPEYVYRKIANWDVEFVEVVFDVYADVMESHKKDLVKNIVFENVKSPEDVLDDLEQRAASLRARLGKPPLVEAQRLDLEPGVEESVADSQDDPPSEEGPEDAPEQEAAPLPVAARQAPRVESSFHGAEDDFDPFEAVKNAARAPAPSAVAAAPSAPPSVPVPVPTAGQPSAIEEAMARRRGQVPSAAPALLRPLVAQPSVVDEVLEKSAARLVVDPPSVNPAPGSQSRNPRFRNAGVPR